MWWQSKIPLNGSRFEVFLQEPHWNMIIQILKSNCCKICTKEETFFILSKLDILLLVNRGAALFRLHVLVLLRGVFIRAPSDIWPLSNRPEGGCDIICHTETRPHTIKKPTKKQSHLSMHMHYAKSVIRSMCPEVKRRRKQTSACGCENAFYMRV